MTARTHIFARTRCFRRYRAFCAVVSACADEVEAALFVSVDEDVGEPIVYYEVYELFTWRGSTPTIFITVGDKQPSRLASLFESSVVVRVASATILNASVVIVVVNHFVKECGDYFFNGS